MLMIPFPRQKRWVLQQQSKSKLAISIDCSKNIVSTMQITIRITMILMTIVLQQSPSITNKTREVEPANLNICIGNASTKALVDLGSVCTIINKSLATTVVSDCKESFWVQSPEMHKLKISLIIQSKLSE